MFGGSSFSELSFAEIPDLNTGISPGSEVAIHFNKSFLTFVMQLNQQADFDLNINSQQDHSLDINKQIDFSVER